MLYEAWAMSQRNGWKRRVREDTLDVESEYPVLEPDRPLISWAHY